jgi:hypothetical protein
VTGNDLAEYFGADDDEGYSEILQEGRKLTGLFARMSTRDQPRASSAKTQPTESKKGTDMRTGDTDIVVPDEPTQPKKDTDIVVPDADDFSAEESAPEPEGGFDFEAGETDVLKNDPSLNIDASTLRELIMHAMMDCIHRFDGARSYHQVGNIAA